MNKPTAPVTVGIPTYARGGCVLAPLERIVSCNPAPAEIIVHVDASDGLLEELIRQKFPIVQVISSDYRIGPGGGRDRCLRRASQPYFVSFDDDSWPTDEGYFARIVAHFEDSPEAGCLMAVVTHRGREAPPPSPWRRQMVDYTGCGHAMRVSAYLSVAGYMDRPNAYGMEERDVSLQLLASGWQIWEHGDLRVFHDTDLSHHRRPEITMAMIENAALLPLLRYPMMLWPYGMLQYLNLIRYLVMDGRFAGMARGIIGTLPTMWHYRHHRQPVSAKAVITYLLNRSREAPSRPLIRSEV